MAYGSWASPITAKFITTSGVGLTAPKCGPDGTLYWLEARPQEAGRQVVCRLARPGEAAATPRGGVDVTPADAYVRTRVHEYGGAAHLLGPDGDGFIYSNFKDQRLYWAKADGSVLCLTPPAVYATDNQFRFADGVLDLPRKRLVCIREDHTDGRPTGVLNTVCAVALDGSGKVTILASGRDFYAAPRLSPDGSKLAYICWDHPNMPWDSTELVLADLDSSTGAPVSSQTVCGGPRKNTSVLQPAWSPEGELHFVSDMTGWWNLYKRDYSGKVVNLCPRDAEFSGSAPGWALGGQNYCFLSDGRIATSYEDRKSGTTKLVLISAQAKPQGGFFSFFSFGGRGSDQAEDSVQEFGQECLPRTFGSLCPSADGRLLYFLGGEPDAPGGIYSWAVPAVGSTDAPKAEMLVCSMSEDMSIDAAFVSSPSLLRFPTAGREVAFGYYYAPVNPNFCGLDGELPPLLVKAHGGPTACARVTLNPTIQFWTSRGFAVLDVDYRGSTGYGRAYREKLQRGWGIVDVQDVCAGAQYLVSQSLADPKRLAIDGTSAGGFTTLAALTFKDVFTAGCSMYGIADLSALAADTHKFESRYIEGLVGRYPAEKNVFDQRAPINHVSRLSCPILLLQGAEDKIVPPNQAEMMYEAVKARGLPCALKMYEGEQHGFRRSENIEDALNSELSFFARIFGFEVAGGAAPLQVANMDPKQDEQASELRNLLLGL